MFDPDKEIILRKNDNRFVIFPITYHDFWKLYKQALASFWTNEEIDFSADLYDWENKLNDKERYFIKNILAFFAASDGIVNENLAINFYSEIQIPEIRSLYASQILIESIHAESYSLMIDTYIKDRVEKDTLFKSLENNPIIQKKANWALKWIDNGSFPERLIAFGAVEGIFFSGSFCSIFWLKSRGLMDSLSLANQFISRDEALHCKTCVMIYSRLEQRLSEKRMHEIFREAYDIEEEFITESLPVSLIGMNSVLMKQYIQYITDYWLEEFGYSKLFNTQNPFAFMNYISLETKSNFFEARVHSYQKANMDVTKGESEFSLNAYF